MKKFKLLALAVMAMLGTNAMAQAVPFTNGQFNYETEGTPSTVSPYKVNAVITGVNGGPASLTGAVAIPETFTQTISGRLYTVTVVGIEDASGYSNTAPEVLQNSLMSELTLPKSLKTIGDYAFAGCTNLTKLTIEGDESALESIGDNAFETTRIAKYDFSNCPNLTGFPDELFIESGKTNIFVTEIVMPTSNTFTEIGTALAGLPNLATTNIKDTKIESVKALAFNGDAKLTSMELPGTVQTINTNAFQGSKISTLTINVAKIENIAATVYGSSNAELVSLTLKGELKGTIAGEAFKDVDKMTTLNLEGMSFGTHAMIGDGTKAAFSQSGADNVGVTSLKLGAIKDNDADKYTIQALAFSLPLLTSVEIGEITAKSAIGATAFGNKLQTVKLGNIYSASDGTKMTIAAGAFKFAAKQDATLTIGNIRATSLNPVFGAAAFTMSPEADDTKKKKTATITIGAVEGKGANFTAGTFKFTTDTYLKGVTMTFKGDIESGAINAMLLDNASVLTTLNFEGNIATNGLASATADKEGAFYGMPTKAVVNFKGSLAKNAIGKGAFQQADDANLLFVNYTGTPANKTVVPFVQEAFVTFDQSTTVAPAVTLTITDETLANIIRTEQIADDDFIYRVNLVSIVQKLIVYQKTGGNTSYGRFEFKASDFPKGLTIDRHQANGTFTLYTTYVEDDATNEVVTINMQPIPTMDGKYRFDTGSWTDSQVIIVKATGTTGERTEMEYTDYDGGDESPVNPFGAPALEVFTKTFGVSDIHVANQQLVESQTSLTAYPILKEVFNDKKVQQMDIYFLNNPSDGKGIKATAWDIASTGAYIAIGSYYVVTSMYKNSGAARVAKIVWNDGSEETTAIQGIEKNAAEADVIFNLAGQKVDANYKGIVIKNGKKMIQK